MQLAKIVGAAKSIAKSDELYGAELLVAVPVNMETMQEDGKPFLVADKLGAQEGHIVVCAAVCSLQQGDTLIDKVIAIPETIFRDGEKQLNQTTGHGEAAEVLQELPEEIDPVSDLTAEFEALHQEIDQLPDTDTLSQNTNSVPYEDYAKYLTTDFEPVDVPPEIPKSSGTGQERRQGYTRVGYRSGKRK